MNIAAYCRVSTDKTDQRSSLRAQKEFFTAYARRTGDTLVRLYADEGVSGTGRTRRPQFLQLLSDAPTGLFEKVVVKDISRFARNTVDLLRSVRALKAQGIETEFLTAHMTGMGSSEFVLTIFAALAQEESANTSQRVKFGKRLTARQGRVPNLVYGYDKIDRFHMAINETEAAHLRDIFHWYVNEGLGSNRIARRLNEAGVPTKRGCQWSQNAVCRLLTNPIYTGQITNGKEEVTDFLTGKRTARPESEWLTVHRPELQIIPPALFAQAKEEMNRRSQSFHTDHTRHSGQWPLSTLLRCPLCGRSFRRIARTSHIRWGCSAHTGQGTCPNAYTISEDELFAALQAQFTAMLTPLPDPLPALLRLCEEQDEAQTSLTSQLQKHRRTRRRYQTLCAQDLMTPADLQTLLPPLNAEIAHLEAQLTATSSALTQKESLSVLRDLLPTPAAFADPRALSNAQLHRLIDRIEVFPTGEIHVYFQPIPPNT